MADIKKPDQETVQLLGKECTAIRRSNGEDKITMKTSDFNEVLASEGVTKEVREAVSKAHNKIATDVIKFMSDRNLKLNKGKKETDKDFTPKTVVQLGSGDGSMEFELRPIVRHTGKDIKTGEPYTTVKYGTVRATVGYQFGKDIRAKDGLLDTIESEFTKVFGKK